MLLEAHKRDVRFSVVLVDSRPMYEAKHLLRLLSSAAIPCTYVLLPALGAVLPTVDLCLLGTHALLSNGAMYGRAGQATVAMMAKSAGVPVVCCCETYKFTDRIMLDSIVSNEMGSLSLHSCRPDQELRSTTGTVQSLIPAASQNPYFALPPTSPGPPSEADGGDRLTLLYDVARPEDVTVVITEAGMIPVQSVPVLQRDYKPLVATD